MFENRVQHKHCHVTANAGALLCDAKYGLNHGLSQTRFKRVQLQDVRPSWKIRIAPTGTNHSMYFHIGERIIPHVVGTASNEVLRVFRHPWMVRCDMVGHEVQDQIHAPVRELAPGNRQAFSTPKVSVDYVASYAKG
jgi:hypothetical protein